MKLFSIIYEASKQIKKLIHKFPTPHSFDNCLKDYQIQLSIETMQRAYHGLTIYLANLVFLALMTTNYHLSTFNN